MVSRRSPQKPQAGWDSNPSELKHQPGRNVAPANTVELYPQGTHLPPERTFLPQNLERSGFKTAHQDTIQTGLSNKQIQATLLGVTSKDVSLGIGHQSQAEARALGDGGRKKSRGGLPRVAKGEILG